MTSPDPSLSPTPGQETWDRAFALVEAALRKEAGIDGSAPGIASRASKLLDDLAVAGLLASSSVPPAGLSEEELIGVLFDTFGSRLKQEVTWSYEEWRVYRESGLNRLRAALARLASPPEAEQ